MTQCTAHDGEVMLCVKRLIGAYGFDHELNDVVFPP